ncbi:MAG: glycosyltransferase family 39 protein [Fimbriimonadaceae bacterium]|nr:glycosyltransferase family 39 protein [Chitinophagales bacterium]
MYKNLIATLVIAFSVRIIWAYLGWNTHFIEAQNNSITIVYQRSAYLLNFGYGYSQALVGSPAYEDISIAMDNILLNENYSKIISEDEVYTTSHYPPGWSIIASVLFEVTSIPIPYAMQGFGIIIDILSLYFFSLIVIKKFPKIAMVSVWVYALFPPFIAISVSMTPDVFIIFYLIVTCYLFIMYDETRKNKFIIISGLVCGVSALFRSDYFLFSFFISILLLLKINKENILNFFKWNIGIAIIALFILLPWALYNKKNNGHLIFTSSSLGGTLVSGLSAYPNPWNLGHSDLDRRDEALEAGIKTPFEYEGDQYFRERFSAYVKDNPGYYLKTILYRTLFFIAAPYSWGVERTKETPSLSQMLKNGNFFSNILIYIQAYFTILISAIFSLFSFFCFGYLLYRKKNIFLIQLSSIIFIYVWATHVFIHITSVYILPVAFMQILIVITFLKRKSYNN